MSYIALYRKWRPLVFEDVVEQKHVVKTLRHTIASGRIAHAYLFCGTRGTGKTTMAKIFSRAINCLQPKDGDPCNECVICRDILAGTILDVIEIDAASNNSVDNVREIRDEVIYAPSFAKYKVYIIDEVHMLSSGAFNALLKTLEEPPEHVVFILATTEPHKLPATILSRCQRFDFRRITIESIAARVNEIALANEITIQDTASRFIARMADGAMRDAISILDQCISVGKKDIQYQDVLDIVGVINDVFIAEMVDAILTKDIGTVLGMVEKLMMDGKDITHFVSDLVYYYRNLMLCKITKTPDDLIEGSIDTIEKMKKQSEAFTQDEIIAMIKELSTLEASLKWATYPRVLLEVSLVKLCENTLSRDDSDVLARLAALERKIEQGGSAIRMQSQTHKGIEKPLETAPIKEKESQIETETKEKRKLDHKQEDSQKDIEFKPLSCWADILSELKAAKKMGIVSNLLDARGIEIDDKFVGIVFKKEQNFNKEIISKNDNIKILEELMGLKLGREIRIKCMGEDDIGTHVVKRQTTPKKDEFMEKASVFASSIGIPMEVIEE